MPKVVGEYVDRLCAIEMRPGQGNLSRNTTYPLYEAARSRSGEPLTLALANALVERVESGQSVFILTGAGGPPVLPNAEVDGLLGAAALARALHFGKEAQPIVLTEDRVREPMKAVSRACGLNFREANDAEMDHAVTFVAMPLDADACERQAFEILNHFSPAAVIAIEKLSPNRKGVIHGGTGLNFDDMHAKPQYIFEESQRRGILTAGIGDGGNEVGFGLIADAVREILPAGEVCKCPCGGGTAARVSTDYLVAAAISNWGGYGVAAMISYLLGRVDILIDEDDVERMLRASVNAGALDGGFARPILSDDLVPLKTHRAFITMLRTILTNAQSSLMSPGH